MTSVHQTASGLPISEAGEERGGAPRCTPTQKEVEDAGGCGRMREDAGGCGRMWEDVGGPLAFPHKRKKAGCPRGATRRYSDLIAE